MTASASNIARPLSLAGRFIEATHVERPRDYPVTGRTIVVNPNRTPLHVDPATPSVVPAFSSTVLVDTRLESGDSALLFRVADPDAMAHVVAAPGWHRLGDLLPASSEYPRCTPLWRGPIESLGIIELDPAAVLGEKPTEQPTEKPTAERPFEVTVNLWFAPAGTDCSIHREHDFIEIHSQLHGLGRMQKFRERDHATLYEDLLMSPGYTTPVPFCRTDPDRGFVYPWHQYRADTDCVWLAVEYHDQLSKGE